MIKTQTKFEKSKAKYYQAYSKNPPKKTEEKPDNPIYSWLYSDDNSASYNLIRQRIIKAFTESKLFDMEEILEERLYRLHKSARFVMNMSFAYDYFKISIYDDNTKKESTIDYLYYKKFSNSNFTNMLYILGRFIKAMDNGIHPEIVVENMEIENTLNELA
jgi:hypothetical protein